MSRHGQVRGGAGLVLVHIGTIAASRDTKLSDPARGADWTLRGVLDNFEAGGLLILLDTTAHVQGQAEASYRNQKSFHAQTARRLPSRLPHVKRGVPV